MIDSTAAAAIVISEVCCCFCSSTTWLRRPFHIDRPIHAVFTVSFGRIIPNRPIEACFQTSVPKTLAKSPSELMTRLIRGKEANCEGSLKEKHQSPG